MTRIDRYLLAEGLPPFLFGLLLYSGLAVVSVTLPSPGARVGSVTIRSSFTRLRGGPLPS